MGKVPPIPPLLAIFTWFGSGGGEMDHGRGRNTQKQAQLLVFKCC